LVVPGSQDRKAIKDQRGSRVLKVNPALPGTLGRLDNKALPE